MIINIVQKQFNLKIKQNNYKKNKLEVNGFQENYKNNKLILKSQQRFRIETHNVFAEEIMKFN